MAVPVNYYHTVKTAEDSAPVDSGVAGWDLLIQQNDFVNRKYAQSTPMSLISRRVFFGGTSQHASGSGTYGSPAIPSLQTGFTLGSTQAPCQTMYIDGNSNASSMMFIPTMVGLMHHPLARVNELATTGDRIALAVGSSGGSISKIITPPFYIAPSASSSLAVPSSTIDSNVVKQYYGTNINGAIGSITNINTASIGSTALSDGTSSPYIVKNGALNYSVNTTKPNMCINSSFDSLATPVTPTGFTAETSGGFSTTTGSFTSPTAKRTLAAATSGKSAITQTIPSLRGQAYTFTINITPITIGSSQIRDVISISHNTALGGSAPTIVCYRTETSADSMFLCDDTYAIISTTQRVSVTVISNSDSIIIKCGVGISASRVASMTVFNPQLEIGFVPTEYVPTSATDTNSPESTMARPSMYYLVPIYQNAFGNNASSYCGGQMMRSVMSHSTDNADRYAGSEALASLNDYGLGVGASWDSLYAVWVGHTRNANSTSVPSHACIRLAVLDIFGVIISPH